MTDFNPFHPNGDVLITKETLPKKQGLSSDFLQFQKANLNLNKMCLERGTRLLVHADLKSQCGIDTEISVE